MRVRTSLGEILLEEFMKPLGLSGAALARDALSKAEAEIGRQVEKEVRPRAA